jgi:hypothetical protein
MFVVERVARGHRYLYLVESVREGKKVRQRTIKALGRKDVLAASGELGRLASSIARHAERSVILSNIDAGKITAHRIGGPLLFGRLWERLGVDAVLTEVLKGRGFGFDVERAVFVATVHRLFVSGSDRACTDWMQSYAIDGAEGLALHHFYRAMAWLGEEIEEQADAGKDAQRYIVTLNEAEAKKDKADRQAIIDGLQAQLKKGDKALVGNSAYRRYLKASGKTFEVDLGKLADEARFDGISVLRTNARITPLQAVIRYHDLLQVEALLRVPHGQGELRYPPDLPSIRCRDPRACVRLVPCPDACQGVDPAMPGQGLPARMAAAAQRSRPPPAGHDRKGRQDDHHPHARIRRGWQRLQGRRHRAPGQHRRAASVISPAARQRAAGCNRKM